MMALHKTLTATLILSLFSFSTQHTFALSNDGIVLLSFKFAILSDPQRVLKTWTISDSTPCSWHGVTCGSLSLDSGRVTGVSLPGGQLLGTIPANFGLLRRLQSLNLSSNSINGSIPETLYSLSTLRVLDVSDNLLSGELSDSIGGLRNLEVFSVSNNAFTGNIPRMLPNLHNLTVILLRGNNFTGTIPGGFDQARFMDMSCNLLSSSLPFDFGGGNIQFCNLSYNRLTKDIPPQFGQSIPRNATLILSYNNFTGVIPNSSLYLNQEKNSFAGNPNLCGPPLNSPCPIAWSPTGLSSGSNHPVPHLVNSSIPKIFASSSKSRPEGSSLNQGQSGKSNGLTPQTIACIVCGDIGGLFIICMILFHIYKTKTKTINTNTHIRGHNSVSMSCLRKRSEVEESDDEESVKSMEEEEGRHRTHCQENGHLVTLDGERELELETLLKASAYILGGSGSSIMYKAVLEDGTVLAVRRVGENGSVERLKEFENYVRGVAKIVHPNLVRVRGFYWSVDEKLVIYEFVPGGSLANVRYRKGTSACHIPWEVRLRIAKGVARGLSYVHEKKHVHGNLKPSNILLDMERNPKIGDFGLDKLITGKSGYMPGGSTHHFGSKRSMNSRDSFQDFLVGATPSPSTSSIGCISPYHPPESLRSLKPNSKTDVYSFGVVLLELLTGKVIISDELGPPVLAEMAVGFDDKTRVLRMVDPTIQDDLEGKEEDLLICLRLGYDCVSHSPQKRPTMKEVVQVLDKI